MSWANKIKNIREDIIGIEDINNFGREIFYVLQFSDDIKQRLFMNKAEKNQSININDFGKILDSGFGKLPIDLVANWYEKLNG